MVDNKGGIGKTAMVGAGGCSIVRCDAKPRPVTVDSQVQGASKATATATNNQQRKRAMKSAKGKVLLEMGSL